MDTILKINNLSIGFEIDEKIYPAVKNIDLEFYKGQIHALAGESGCGKTISMMSILGLLPNNSKILSGEILFEGQNLINLKEKDLQKLRGQKIALIPQDPMTSLNPLYTIEDQLVEAIKIYKRVDTKQARKIALEALEEVEIPNAKERLKAYPHELSGGMKQRVIIAIALAADAEIIIADEPTTALDVTIQAQILKLLQNIKYKGKTIILITHDLGVVNQYADYVSIMYAGKIVEQANVKTLFKIPRHPYTKALLAALPVIKGKKLENIKGQVAPITEQVEGCPFHPRCKFVMQKCKKIMPELHYLENSSKVACHLFS